NHESSYLTQQLMPLGSNYSDVTLNFKRPYFSILPYRSVILADYFAELHLSYNAMQASLNRRFANGLNILASYTWAHTLCNADGNVGGFIQNAHAVNTEYGNVQPDLRQRFVVRYSYDLPVGRGRRFMSDRGGIADAVLGGWEIGGITSAQSGEAVTALMSADLSNTGTFYYRPDQINDPTNF